MDLLQDWLKDMARTVVNVVGNALATVVMSKWEGRFGNKKEETNYSSVKELVEN